MANPAKVFFDNPFYDGQFMRSVSAVDTSTADRGEVFATARGIHSLTGEAWYEAWSRIARSAWDDGQKALAVGDKSSAREAFLRASEYFRQAYYFIRSDLDDKRLQAAYHQHVDSLVTATELMETPVSRVRIPFDDTTISEYLFAPLNDGAPRATLLFPCGYDSTAEAGWSNVPAALERG